MCELPFLLNYYKQNFKMMNLDEDITKRYNLDNRLNDEQNEILKKEILGDEHKN